MNIKRQITGEILSLDYRLPIGVGGEGNIYAVQQRDNLAVKVYHRDRLNAERVSKLKTMLAHVPIDPMREKDHASIAWPIDLVHTLNNNQAVVGFLMPRIRNAQPIHHLRDAETRTVFPSFTYRALCRTARNLASAVRAIHETGNVIGDVNDSNILVTADALVTLVDTDSFQVTDHTDGRVYRCTVGTPLFTPPELFGKNLEEVDRSEQQDMFTLAILFFQLLMEGTWPFACVLTGVDDAPDCIERLRQGCFPYDGHPGMNPPPWAPPFEMLHPSLQSLFRQCFVAGHAHPQSRPDARTWYRVLKECEESFTGCPVNTQHYYFNHCAYCPWCERAQRVNAGRALNWDPFPPPKTASRFSAGDQTGAPPPRRSWQSAPSDPRHRQSSHSATAPAHSFFSASATSVSPGQSVTLQWAVPNAQIVRITDQAGGTVFAGNSPNGFVTIYPTKNKTYQLDALGFGVSLPNPVTVSVTQMPRLVTLQQVSVELREPISLHSARVSLLPVIILRERLIQLRSPLKLKNYLRLNSYCKLNRITVELKNHIPVHRGDSKLFE